MNIRPSLVVDTRTTSPERFTRRTAQWGGAAPFHRPAHDPFHPIHLSEDVRLQGWLTGEPRRGAAAVSERAARSKRPQLQTALDPSLGPTRLDLRRSAWFGTVHRAAVHAGDGAGRHRATEAPTETSVFFPDRNTADRAGQGRHLAGTIVSPRYSASSRQRLEGQRRRLLFEQRTPLRRHRHDARSTGRPGLSAGLDLRCRSASIRSRRIQITACASARIKGRRCSRECAHSPTAYAGRRSRRRTGELTLVPHLDGLALQPHPVPDRGPRRS